MRFGVFCGLRCILPTSNNTLIHQLNQNRGRCMRSLLF